MKTLKSPAPRCRTFLLALARDILPGRFLSSRRLDRHHAIGAALAGHHDLPVRRTHRDRRGRRATGDTDGDTDGFLLCRRTDGLRREFGDIAGAVAPHDAARRGAAGGSHRAGVTARAARTTGAGLATGGANAR